MAVTRQEVVFEFDANTGEFLKATKKLEESMEGVADAAQDAADSTEDIGKQAKKSGSILRKAGKAGADAFKLVGAAITASGLIKLAEKILTPIIEAFLENKKVADTLRLAMAGIGAIIDTIIDLTGPLVDKLFAAFSDPKQAVLDLKDAIQKNIEVRIEGLLNLFPRLGEAIKAAFRGDFAEAGKIAADAMGQVTLGVENITDKVAEVVEDVKEFGEEFVETVQKQVQGATRLEKAMIALDDRQRDLNVRTAQAAAEVEELKRQRDDERLSIEERIAAAEAAAEIDQRLADENVAIAEERARLLRQEIELQGETEERLDALAEAEIAAADARAASAGVQTELMTSIYGLNQELIDQERERLEAEEEARLEREEALAEEQRLKDEAAAKDAERRAKELEEERATAEAIKQAKLDIAKSSLDALAALNEAFTGESEAEQKRGFERSKKIQTAQALISTYESAVQAFKSLAGIPVVGPALGSAAAAAAVVAGLANVKKIQSQTFQGGSASGGGDTYQGAGTTPSAGATNIQAPTLDLGFLGAGAGQQAPIRAYVLAENVSTAQQANQKIQDQATL